MPAKLIDGKVIAKDIRADIAEGVKKLVAAGSNPPGLGVILVGENPASQAYVRMKTKACAEAGLHSVQQTLSEDVSEDRLVECVHSFNKDPKIHGILVQLPLPKHINERRILFEIDPDKDVDGFHPVNVGRLNAGLPGFVPCTPLGIQEMLICSGVQVRGSFAVIIGRSNIVGRPMAALLSQKGEGGDATVCICHSRTKDIPTIAKQADILIAAIGSADFVTADMVKPGATVIDVGMNRVDDASREKGYRLTGDVDFEAVKEIAGAITPVPGGVGPMTIAMLLRNTLASAKGEYR